jgi:hypothetical protein
MATTPLVTTSGKVLLAAAAVAANPFPILVHGIGTDHTTVSDVALESRDGTNYATCTVAASTNTMVYTGTLASVAGATITEVGLFPTTTVTGGCAYHEIFTGVVLAAGDSIVYTITITFA